MARIEMEATKINKAGNHAKNANLLRAPSNKEKDIVPFGLSPRKEMLEENPLLHLCNKSNKTGKCSHAL